jgi:hypothetical protein
VRDRHGILQIQYANLFVDGVGRSPRVGAWMDEVQCDDEGTSDGCASSMTQSLA